MECILRSGFLRYSTVGVLIEPDLYDPNNQQGWWDDEHWQRGPGNRAKRADSWISSHGQFVAPYETARKWAGAVKGMGGVPMIYMQTGFRSQDYAETFPGHMIFNEPDALHLNDQGEQMYRDKGKTIPRKLGYDYTDPDFVRHVREVWENLRLAGIQGCKFDYPDFPFTGWPTRGGLEDPYSTTAMHYRNIFRLARDGMGHDSFIHERTLDRGSDVTLGLSTSQRTEGDTVKIDKHMISRNGLRWYKNRVVINYDMDLKDPFQTLPANRDGQRSMLTMSYIVTGVLMVAPSFGRMTPEMIHDLSRLYPYHRDRRSARPVDAFTNEFPEVYDFRIDSRRRQVTFVNHDVRRKRQIGVDLAGDTAFGGLGLDPQKEYYAYDFWNDAFIGRLPGNSRLEQTLRAGEARMMAIREVLTHPQAIATDRHLMQGYVDLPGCTWDPATRTLSGVSVVPAGESVRIIIAGNGRNATGATIDESIEHRVLTSRQGAQRPVSAHAAVCVAEAEGLLELTVKRSGTGPVAWRVLFNGPIAKQQTVGAL